MKHINCNFSEDAQRDATQTDSIRYLGSIISTNEEIEEDANIE